MGNVRDVEPCAMQVRPRQPFQARQWPCLDRPELGEILGRDRGDPYLTRGAAPARLATYDPPEVVLGDAPLFAAAIDLRQIDVELARKPAHCRTRMHRAEIRGCRKV